MAKPERGLPKSFTIRVPDGPVTLGDYLDEPPAPIPAPAPPPVPSHQMAAAPVLPPAPEPVAPPPTPAVAPIAAPPAANAPVSAPPTPSPAAARATPPRRQFNMSPDTLRMLDDLVNHIRMHSVERDIRASEVVHALVLAAHEVRPYMDLGKVPARGKWGSATAAALPAALKTVFQEAIRRR